MNLILCTDAQAREMFDGSEQWGDDGVDHGAHPTSAMLRVLADLADVLPDDVTLVVCRDWEGCPIGVFPDHADTRAAWEAGLGDVIALTDNGGVGSGGVNQPRYYDSVASYVSHNLRRRAARA